VDLDSPQSQRFLSFSLGQVMMSTKPWAIPKCVEILSLSGVALTAEKLWIKISTYV
jgi:hypothetical protein